MWLRETPTAAVVSVTDWHWVSAISAVFFFYPGWVTVAYHDVAWKRPIKAPNLESFILFFFSFFSSSFFPFFFLFFLFISRVVISKEAIGISWEFSYWILYAILGHKYHQNHPKLTGFPRTGISLMILSSKVSIKTHSIERRCVIELENMLFAGLCLHQFQFQPGNWFYRKRIRYYLKIFLKKSWRKKIAH